MKKLFATSPAHGNIYRHENGKFFHVAPDGTETEIEIEDGSDIAFSDIKGPVFHEADQEAETTVRFSEMPDQRQQVVVEMYAQRLQAPKAKIQRILKLADPLVICGGTYFRIHTTSADLLKRLLIQYL